MFCIPFPKKLKEFDKKALSYISIWHCSILKRSAFSWILRYLEEKYWKNILGPDWRTIESTGDREAPCMQIIKSDENLVLKRKIVHQQRKRKKHKKVLQEEDIERLCRNIVLENIWAAGYNSKKNNRRKKVTMGGIFYLLFFILFWLRILRISLFVYFVQVPLLTMLLTVVGVMWWRKTENRREERYIRVVISENQGDRD